MLGRGCRRGGILEYDCSDVRRTQTFEYSLSPLSRERYLTREFLIAA
jgi:hypothetical protein